MAGRSVMDRVEELLAQRKLYEPADDLVEKLWLSKYPEEARELALFRMRDLARDNIASNRSAAASEQWLHDAARALDVMQVKRTDWITVNIAPVGRAGRSRMPATTQLPVSVHQPRPEPRFPPPPPQLEAQPAEPARLPGMGRGRGRGRGRALRQEAGEGDAGPTAVSSATKFPPAPSQPPGFVATSATFPPSRYPYAPTMDTPTPRLYPPPTAGSTYPGVREERTRALKPRAFDSHFHLDRTLKVMRLHSDAGLQELIDGTHVDSRKEVRLVGTCAVFCDPATFPTQRQLREWPDNMAIAAGFHPRHCSQFTRAKVESGISRLAELVRSPRVVGFGEIGLEHTEAMDTWHVQADAVQKMLPFCERRHVLILHCRGMRGDSGAEAYLLLLHLVRKGVPRDQRVHLHCFTGDEYVRDQWLQNFPNLYFGFTRMVDSFNREQVNALRGISLDRLLLETDAPYFTGRGERWSAPNQLYLTAESVARNLDMPVETLLETTTDNALRLYMSH